MLSVYKVQTFDCTKDKSGTYEDFDDTFEYRNELFERYEVDPKSSPRPQPSFEFEVETLDATLDLDKDGKFDPNPIDIT